MDGAMCQAPTPVPSLHKAGVLALTPSARLLDALLAAVATTPSYTGGDQGFLNAFFAGGWLQRGAGRVSNTWKQGAEKKNKHLRGG